MPRRDSLFYKLSKALLDPGKVIPHLKRVFRNRKLQGERSDFLDFYSGVVDDMVSTDPDKAVGAADHDAWLQVGELQFKFLTSHGLQPTHRFLDIGCGNLRAGWRFIEYLEQGNYTGTDISPKVLHAALDTMKSKNLQAKRPYLYVVKDCDFSFLPAESIDVAHAHSVFSHLPLPLIEQCLTQLLAVLKPGGFFDFTFLPSDRTYSFCDEDFYYPDAELLDVARRAGYDARLMEDWDYPQKKIRATKPGLP